MTTDISTIEQELTEALQKAVPHITTAYSTTLEDVLRALQFQCHYQVCNWGSMKDVSRIAIKGREDECQWIIGKPLSEQKEYVKHFLHSLLCQ